MHLFHCSTVLRAVVFIFAFEFFRPEMGKTKPTTSGQVIRAVCAPPSSILSGIWRPVRPQAGFRRVGYRHDGDALRLDTNGYSYPSTLELLDAAVVEPRGRTVPLKDFHRGCYSPTTKEYVQWWVLPRTMTNFVSCGLRLSRRDDGKYVATCRSR